LSGITQYVYDQAGHLLVESDDSGNTLTEYVWLDDMPIALIANVNTSPSLYFVHTDHLNRPIMMTDANKAIVWQADYNPFGGVYSITGSAINNLRFPGQYFPMEDGLHYNWYRHYDPSIGRYVQPDPLGFIDGPGIYEYAHSTPLMKTDSRGLFISPANLGSASEESAGGNPCGAAPPNDQPDLDPVKFNLKALCFALFCLLTGEDPPDVKPGPPPEPPKLTQPYKKE
jgi:RHS repeat-associated protein